MSVIKATGLSKKYRLGVIARKMLVDQIESYVARKLGRPDPHARIHEKNTDRMPSAYDFWALKDVSFEVKKGDIIGVMGRNGSGKSTLLKLLSRITAPTEGEAELHGRVASLLEVGTGFHPELTGRENVFLNGSILGLKRKEVEERYQMIVDFAEIPNFMDTPVKRYSSGMRVRLAFAVAAHLEPEILILDEVLAVGDAAFQEKCLEKIEATKHSGVTILFVSHSSASVKQLCNRAIVLNEGRLVFEGSAAEATNFYTQSLHLHSNMEGASGPSARRGELIGAISALLARSLPNGHVLVDVPIETKDGIRKADVAWISNARRATLCREPAYSGAPEICVHLKSHETNDNEFFKNRNLLMKSGAKENWICSSDGVIEVHKVTPSAAPLIAGVQNLINLE
ncbi:MAG: ABC transporter ATP-binding protein [Proteobacteria bacterium]|nr:ABC transporter ATP-binding protein [Pseudomonadota bacterium]